ncbi:MAG: thioredoxin domain-containing protein [Oleiphilaceae bacterium]|nr:thioredoxin domain-containing protein [Oleiphilaceae bacterium]
MGEAKRRKQTGQPSSKRLREQRQKRLYWAGGIASVVVVVALVLFLTTPGVGPGPALPEPSPNPFPAQLDRHGIHRGDPDAPVVVREFADYQCPACARFADQTHERLVKEYIETGKVRLVFFEMPLRQHDNAVPAAMAARCAGAQDAYWAMQHRLFERQPRWDNSSDPVTVFTGYAGELGLDERRFERCLANERPKDQVDQSLSVAQQVRVRSTPTVIVNNTTLSRSNWEQLSAVIERELAKAE